MKTNAQSLPSAYEAKSNTLGFPRQGCAMTPRMQGPLLLSSPFFVSGDASIVDMARSMDGVDAIFSLPFPVLGASLC